MAAYDYKKVSDYVDKHLGEFKDLLKEAVSIPSVSATASLRQEVFRMIEWYSELLKSEGATTELIDLGTQKLDGKDVPLPPALFGCLGSDPSKKTVCIYGHLDVQPAAKEDGWDTEPFILTEKDGRMYGRGSTDDKGPVIGWIAALRTFAALNIDLPVNLKVGLVKFFSAVIN